MSSLFSGDENSKRDKIESPDQGIYCLFYLNRLLISTRDIIVNVETKE